MPVNLAYNSKLFGTGCPGIIAGSLSTILLKESLITIPVGLSGVDIDKIVLVIEREKTTIVGIKKITTTRNFFIFLQPS